MSHSIDLRISETVWQELRQRCKTSFVGDKRFEAGAIGLFAENKTRSKHELLVTNILWPQSGDIKEANQGYLAFDASYIRRAHLQMRRDNLSGIITFHTHPSSQDKVTFSYYDDEQDPLLFQNLLDIEPKTKFISVVLGSHSQCGRLWLSPQDNITIRYLISVGEQLQYLPLDGFPAPPSPSASALFDRGLAITGDGALARLAQMRIVVVGASGTGSLVCELLHRAGCRNVIVIDPQILEDANLNRILYANTYQAEKGLLKVDVLKEGIESSGLGCSVTAIPESVTSKNSLDILRSADIIFGCVDKGVPRQHLSKIAFQYLLPYIDVGTEIGTDKTGKAVVSLDARVSYVAPGRPCLMCTGVVTPRQLSFESVTKDEQERIVSKGYSNDLIMTQPAVMDLNMRAASLGVLLLRHLLQPFMQTPLPITFLENAVMFSTKARHDIPRQNIHCPICGQSAMHGYGDCANPEFTQKVSVVHP
jgi:molybdopterin/thiamine biosynthesis adenylyltransferase